MKAQHFLVPTFLLFCILLGGATLAGHMANLVLQLAALPILALALVRTPHGLSRSAKALQWLTVCLFVLIGLQLVPLPPAIWTMLPGREPVAEGYRLLGQPLPWLPLTLAADDTTAAALRLLPAAAVLFAMVRMGAFRPVLIAWTIVAATVVSVLIGAIQVGGGADSPMYFYRVTNRGLAVGPFANANHMATLLLICIPFLFALIRNAKSRNRSRAGSGIIMICVATLVMVAVGLVINTSLAGIGLAVPVVLCSLLLLRPQTRVPAWGLAGVGAISIAAVALVFTLPIGNNLVGESASDAGSRATSISVTLKAAGDYLPLGSGFGTFPAIYRGYEDPGAVTRTWMNHAHSDYSELLLEGGLPVALLVIVFLLWWARQVFVIWRSNDKGSAFARAATIATAAVLLHSIVDYPLRTAAISALMAACLVLISGAREATARRPEGETDVRHLSA